MSQLIDYLEIDLGYSLFDRSTRPLALTDAGQRLYRQARLFLLEAHAFARSAQQIPQQLATQLTLCYDPLTPRVFLLDLATRLEHHQVRLDMLMCEREDAEIWLDSGKADIGLFQALNRSVNDHLHWRAVGSIQLSAYARTDYFHSTPVSMLQLASRTQLIPYRHLSPLLAQRVQIADDVVRVNEMMMLEQRLCAGEGWAFLPDHLQAQRWENVARLETELGVRGLSHPLVALWKPGQLAQPLLKTIFATMTEAWRQVE